MLVAQGPCVQCVGLLTGPCRNYSTVDGELLRDAGERQGQVCGYRGHHVSKRERFLTGIDLRKEWDFHPVYMVPFWELEDSVCV